jgi:hypothetical protein
MTLFRFCHAQKNAFTFFVPLSFREISVGSRGLDFRLPIAPRNIDRLLMVFVLTGHVALKPKEVRFPMDGKILGAHAPRVRSQESASPV